MRGAAETKTHTKRARGFYTPADADTGVGGAPVRIRRGNVGPSPSLVRQGAMALVTCRIYTPSSCPPGGRSGAWVLTQTPASSVAAVVISDR